MSEKKLKGQKYSQAFEDSKVKPGEKPPHRDPTVGLINAHNIKRTLSRLWKMNRYQLQRLVNDKDTAMGEIALAAVLVSAATEGDPQKLAFLLDRMVGKPKPSQEKPEEIEELKKIPSDKLIALLEDVPNNIIIPPITVDVEKT